MVTTEAADITLSTGGRAVRARAGWTLVDQSVSSATNFAFGVLAARTLPPSEFGAFSVAFTVYLFALGISRALSSEPLVVRYSAAGDARRRAASRGAVGSAMCVGVAGGLATIAVSGLLGGHTGHALLVLGLLLPGLLVQDAWRFVFFTEGRPARAVVNDALWAAIQVIAFTLIVLTDHVSVVTVVVAWGVPATIASVAAIRQSGAVPSPRSAPLWLREQRDLGPRFVGEFVTSTGGAQLVMLFLGVIAGTTELGALRAALVVVSPLNILVIAASAMATPEAARLRGRSPSRLNALCIGTSALVALAALLWLAALMTIPGVGQVLAGENWHLARPVVLPLGVMMAASGMGVGAQVGLRALAAARRSLNVRLATLPLLLLGTLGGALGGALGTAYSLAGVYLVSAAFGWWQFHVALLQEDREVHPCSDANATQLKVESSLAPKS